MAAHFDLGYHRALCFLQTAITKMVERSYKITVNDEIKKRDFLKTPLAGAHVCSSATAMAVCLAVAYNALGKS